MIQIFQIVITVYHITSRPKKQAFLGPITKLVAKLVARHKTSRIQGIWKGVTSQN